MFAKIIVLSLPVFLECEYIYEIDCDGAEIGKRVKLNFNGKNRTGIISEINIPEPNFETKKVVKIIDDYPLITSELISIAKWMSKFYSSSLSQVFSLMLPSNSSKGKVKDIDLIQKNNLEIKLNDEQNNAYINIKETLSNLKSLPMPLLYLWGVTGSGKTIVYLKIAKDITISGKSVIYLVPEIGLTVQLYSQVLAFFKSDEIAIIHSSISAPRRTKIWQKALKGEIKIILATRSGIFTPIKNLGLIIMDEEQDSSYKSDNSPHFSTRQVAIIRAKNNNCALLAGSATPSFEYLKLIRENKVKTFYLNKRINDYKLPKISIVNSLSSPSPLTPTLESAMKRELDKGRQVILFLNRRGFLYHYKCPDCGYEIICPHCSVSMTYHREKNMFICHRCGEKARSISSCPNCGNKNEIYSGYGTEYVEKIVHQVFPFSKTLRMDADNINSDKKAKEIIDAFENNEADILIGTQMISKGLTFPSVSLVGVLNASSSVTSNDFRADERLFSLLTQVAGRSGRGLKEGQVIIQTDDEQNNAILAIKNQNSEKFYSDEMAIREKFKYPPFSRLAKIGIRSVDEFIANKTIEEIATLVNIYISQFTKAIKEKDTMQDDYITIFSYGRCPIYKEKDNFRMQLVLKSNNVNHLIRAINSIKSQIKYTTKFHLEIDIDPINLL